ncbi:hypothetical protein [Priestia koreensis]|nr:hypothetical protein [Priestia koreensis]
MNKVEENGEILKTAALMQDVFNITEKQAKNLILYGLEKGSERKE